MSNLPSPNLFASTSFNWQTVIKYSNTDTCFCVSEGWTVIVCAGARTKACGSMALCAHVFICMCKDTHRSLHARF